MKYQVMAHLKLGDQDDAVSIAPVPKWINHWYDCEYLESIVGNDLDNFHVRIFVPELDYECVVSNFYLREKP